MSSSQLRPLKSFISPRIGSHSPICSIAETFKLSQPVQHKTIFRTQREQRSEEVKKHHKKVDEPLILIPKEKILYRPKYELKYPKPREDLPQALIDFDSYHIESEKLVPILRPKFKGLVQETSQQVDNVHAYTESLRQRVDLEDLKELKVNNRELKRKLESAKRKARASVDKLSQSLQVRLAASSAPAVHKPHHKFSRQPEFNHRTISTKSFNRLVTARTPESNGAWVYASYPYCRSCLKVSSPIKVEY
mmetsp:Transcript_33430/g.58583  ORF Transcript_33430/g.58583 Transcript_33430/m.58583 type:complete len:249 (+) Transcript_33430:21-767(+)